ncbi:mixed-linked glucanase precursor, partial [Lojkania enalia]
SPHTNSTYVLKDDLSGENFFRNFELYSDADPTKGFVQYSTLDKAVPSQLVGYLDSSIFLGVNYKNKTPGGRPSVRAESTKSWNHGLLIADIKHMPANICGTWPAFWLLSATQEWPNGGEIDILEGVNDYESNSVTLHTSAGCMVENSTSPNDTTMNLDTRTFTGHMATQDCDVNASNQDKNVGCTIRAPVAGLHSTPTYGQQFNDIQGGVYAMEWTTEYISTWFFPRNANTTSSATQPLDSITTAPNPSTWPTPLAKFQGPNCDFMARFRDLKIIFNTAFCGEWAGRAEEWNKSCRVKTRVETCEEWVGENPEAFVEAYWEIAGLWWFERG